MQEERSIQDKVWDELKVVRKRGLARLEAPSRTAIGTPNLEEAAVNVPGYQPNLSRIKAIELLLDYEIGLMKSSPYREWLPISFGLRDDLRSKSPAKLRILATEIAGEVDPGNFGRTGGKEQEGLAALAAQIVADCLTENQDQAYSASVLSAVPSESITLTSNPTIDAEPAVPATGTVAVAQHFETSPAALTIRSRRFKLRFLISPIAIIAVATIVLALALVWPSDSGPSGDGPLRITKTLIYDAEYGDSFVFSSEQKNTAQQFIKKLDQQGVVKTRDASLFEDALDAGAYLYGGARLQLVLKNPANQELTVSNVWPVIRERRPVAVEAAFLFPHGGTGGVYGMQFVLDDRKPVAKEIPPTGQAPRNFFDIQSIDIRKGDNATLVLYLYAQTTAFAFDIAIEYIVEGKTYTAYVNRNGKPFLVSAVPCGVKDMPVEGLNVEEKKRLTHLRYKAIREETPTEDGLGMIMKAVNPVGSCA